MSAQGGEGTVVTNQRESRASAEQNKRHTSTICTQPTGRYIQPAVAPCYQVAGVVDTVHIEREVVYEDGQDTLPMTEAKAQPHATRWLVYMCPHTLAIAKICGMSMLGKQVRTAL